MDEVDVIEHWKHRALTAEKKLKQLLSMLNNSDKKLNDALDVDKTDVEESFDLLYEVSADFVKMIEIATR